MGILPYVVYGALTEVLRGWPLVFPGILIVPAHAWLTVSKRYLTFDEYPSRAIYVVPIVLTVIVLPLGILAGHLLDKRQLARAPANHASKAEPPRRGGRIRRSPSPGSCRGRGRTSRHRARHSR